MSPSNPVTTVSTSIRIGDLKYAQVSITRQYTSRHHSATLASQLRVGRVMRHLLREIDPLMGMPPYAYGGQHTARPVAHICEYDDCDQLALPGDDWCAEHKAEHDQLMLETVDPETPTEYRQFITTEFESATLAAQYAAANDARREG